MYIFFCPQDFDLLDNLLDIGHVISCQPNLHPTLYLSIPYP